MELINREELYGMEKILATAAHSIESKVLMDQVLYDIEHIPAVEAEPVRHGHWIERQEPLSWCEDDVDVFFECSICGSTDCADPPYCSYCGAKMAVEPHASCINCKHSKIIPDGDMIWVDCPKRDGRCSYHNMWEPKEVSE